MLKPEDNNNFHRMMEPKEKTVDQEWQYQETEGKLEQGLKNDKRDPNLFDPEFLQNIHNLKKADLVEIVCRMSSEYRLLEKIKVLEAAGKDSKLAAVLSQVIGLVAIAELTSKSADPNDIFEQKWYQAKEWLVIFLWICKIAQLIAVILLGHVIKAIQNKKGQFLDRETFTQLKKAATASKIMDCVVLFLQVPMMCHFQSYYGDKYVMYYLVSVLLTIYDQHQTNLSQKPAEDFLRFMETPARVVRIFKEKFRARVQAAIFLIKMKIDIKHQQEKKIQDEHQKLKIKEEAVPILFKKAEEEAQLYQMQVENLKNLQKAFDTTKQKLDEDEDNELEVEDLKEYKVLMQAMDNTQHQLERANFAKQEAEDAQKELITVKEAIKVIQREIEISRTESERKAQEGEQQMKYNVAKAIEEARLNILLVKEEKIHAKLQANEERLKQIEIQQMLKKAVIDSMDLNKKKTNGHRRNVSMKTMLSIDIENLRKKCNELEFSASQKEGEYNENLKQLQDTLKDQTKQVQSLADQFENKEKQLEELREGETTEKTQLQTKLEETKQKNEAVEEELIYLRASSERQREQKLSLAEQQTQMQQSIDKLKQDKDEVLKAFQEQLAKIFKEKQDKEKVIASQDEAIQSTNVELEQVNQRISLQLVTNERLTEDKSNLVEENQTIKDQIQESQKQVSEQSKQLDELRMKIQSHQEQQKLDSELSGASKQQIEQLNEAKNYLTKELEERTSQLEVASNTIKERNQEIQKHIETINAFGDRIKELESQLVVDANSSEEIKDLMQKIEDQKAKFTQDLFLQVKELNEQKEKFQNYQDLMVNDYKKKIEEMEAESKSVEKKSTDMQTEYEKKIVELTQNNSDEMSTIKTNHSGEVETIKKEHSDKLQAETSALKLEQDQSLSSMTQQHEDKIEKMAKEVSSRVIQLNEQHGQIAIKEAEHAQILDQMQELQQSKDNKIEALQNDIKTLETQQKQHQDKLKSWDSKTSDQLNQLSLNLQINVVLNNQNPNTPQIVNKDTDKKKFDATVLGLQKLEKLSVQKIIDKSEYTMLPCKDQITFTKDNLNTDSKSFNSPAKFGFGVNVNSFIRVSDTNYSGTINADGKRQGVGRYIRYDGNIVEGQFSNGKEHGYQRVICEVGYSDEQYNNGNLVSSKKYDFQGNPIQV